MQLRYRGRGGSINISGKISHCKVLAYLDRNEGIAWTIKIFKCLGGTMHHMPIAGCENSTNFHKCRVGVLYVKLV